MKSSPRIGYENNFLKHNNRFYGILIGADFCAEHEYGISRIKEGLGVNVNKNPGPNRRVNSKISGDFKIYFYKSKNGEKSALIGTEFNNTNEVFKEKHVYNNENPNVFIVEKANIKELKHYINCYYNDDFKGIAGAWDDRSFGMMASGKEETNNLEAVFKALMNNDLIVTTHIHKSGKGDLPCCGLAFFIASEIPEDLRKQMTREDEASDILKEISKDIDKSFSEKSNFFSIIFRINNAHENFIANTVWKQDSFNKIMENPNYIPTKYDVLVRICEKNSPYRIFYLEFDEAIKLARTGVVKQDDDYTISPS